MLPPFSRVLCDRSQFGGTAPLADGFLFSPQAGVDQTEHTQRRSLIGLFAYGALEFGTRRGKRFLRCCIVAESTRHTSF